MERASKEPFKLKVIHAEYAFAGANTTPAIRMKLSNNYTKVLWLSNDERGRFRRFLKDNGLETLFPTVGEIQIFDFADLKTRLEDMEVIFSEYVYRD
jgi:hypothetical protein